MPGCDGSFNDGREAVGPVMAVSGKAADPRAVPLHHQPVAVVFDFVDPKLVGRWPRHLRRQPPPQMLRPRGFYSVTGK
jgi:hypothetical protein